MNETHESKELLCTTHYWNNTKNPAHYCESELSGNNLVLIEMAFFVYKAFMATGGRWDKVFQDMEMVLRNVTYHYKQSIS